MKLELKHLAPYLPYGLKIRCLRKGQILFIEDLVLTGEILDYILSNLLIYIITTNLYSDRFQTLQKRLNTMGKNLCQMNGLIITLGEEVKTLYHTSMEIIILS